MNTNLLQFGIASIVDANTGYAVTADYRSTHTAAAERRGREIRSRAVIDAFRAIGAKLAGLAAKYHEYREERHAVARLGTLNDHQLADIGLDRSDLFNVAAGVTRLDDVLALRRGEREQASSGQDVATTSVGASDHDHGLSGALRRFIAKSRDRAEHRRQVKQLLAMDERQLRDIGLNRGDLIAVEMGQLSLAELNEARQQRRQSVRLLSVARKARSTSVDHSELAQVQAAKCA